MTVTTNFFAKPRLRDGVRVQLEADVCVLAVGDKEIEVDLVEGARDESARLVTLLGEGGRTLDAIAAEVPALRDQLGDVCRELDRHGLLTESDLAPAEAKSGAQFFRELARYVDAVKRAHPQGPFQAAIRDGSITRDQLVGYALEYYHVVRTCPGLLGPSLMHLDSRETSDRLQDFLASELRHDRMLERSLASVGVTRAQLDAMIPLPMTFSVLSSLGTYARLHPPSFKASLFLFEEPDAEFNALFRARCEERGLPAAFYGPILDHAAVNEDGDHDSISKVLYDDVPCVDAEEARVIKRHVGVLVECFAKMERQVFDYYGAPGNPIPRVFE